MMVVVDADGVVLWRGGAREVLRRADEPLFVEGACWDLKNAGANGIALALMTGRTVKVCGWEHYVQAQHELSCAAAPVRDPQDGRVLCVLNLTANQPTVHHALLREIDTIAIRVHRQLRTLWTPRATQGREHGASPAGMRAYRPHRNSCGWATGSSGCDPLDG